ncbi:glycoside hydrolase domain-containing protein [Leifsonia sp. NPDC102414]|uniref:glycoside hydrolase domain-containing protein n=1 Tax=Leifsonia sp. NPDC102414 TaxID=3364124 RepID=UPI00380495C0
MVDQMVLKAQKWVNATYAGVDGYTPCPEDGETGWETIDCLIEGLQHELGISPVVDSFGPTTWRLLQAHGDFTATNTTDRFTHLIQCALYCKGYSGGQIDGVWDRATQQGIQGLLKDMNGHVFTSYDVTPKLFRALLNMDAFVLLPGGNQMARQVQQWMNSTYIDREDFLYVPCDGLFSRNVQTYLLYAIQYEIGMADGVANGNFGPGTKAGLKAHPITVGAAGNWARLFQGALIFNQQPVKYFDDTFDADDSAVTLAFQKFAGFQAAAQTGIGDYATWCELLVSTGDPDRPGTAADMASTITPARAQALVAAGYKYVGRYLTNYQLPGALDKNIKPGELDTIFGAGLRLFPIFEEGGDDQTWFTYNQGVTDAKSADSAARGYGFLYGTVIYFAVDFDATDDDIDELVLPYFRGVRDGLGLLGSPYTVGVYGTRNVCSRAINAGLAQLGFVAGLSTGWSGNLGFPLPGNWAFNQIDGLTVGSGDSSVDIDKDVASGRDLGQGTVDTNPPVDPNEDVFKFLAWIQIQAEQFASTHSEITSIPLLIAQYMRGTKYDDAKWILFGGERNPEFITKVDNAAAAAGIQIPVDYFEPAVQARMDLNHFFATMNGNLYHDQPDSRLEPVLTDLGGWAGDLVTTLADYTLHKLAGETTLQFGMRCIGAFPPNEYSFGYDDFIQDTDGFNYAAEYAANSTRTIAQFFRDLVNIQNGRFRHRYADFVTNRFGGDLAAAKNCAEQVFLLPGDTAEHLAFNAARTKLLGFYSSGVHVSDFTEDQLKGLSDAWAQIISSRAENG